MNIPNVGIQQFTLFGLGAFVSLTAPVILALVWIFKKKERFTTILVGAVTFILFALILEKPLQALVISIDHPVKRFLYDNPVLLSLVAALFAGVFEETGRFAAYKTILRKRTNKETSISYGIGHGGIEVMLIMGYSYIINIVYGVMMNTGAIRQVIDQTLAAAPEQADAIRELLDTVAGFGISGLALGLFERVFAVLFHVGASVIVFYACKDKKKTWLYPLAIALHTLMDFIAALQLFKLITIPGWALEGIFAVFGIAVFFGAYLLLYKKDVTEM
ncbi:MAG: YhfC family intramembrane metalloprotease [Lachnospiraceae bacterium]|nr:YhfC family intramembrane metalloprotease [Lachnospiraceae bacterium]